MKKMLGRLFWAGIGAGVAYLMDPVSGRTRRARMQQQAAASLRDTVDQMVKNARYEAGRIKGSVYEAIGTEQPPANDAVLLQKVRSEAIGSVPDANVDVRVAAGVVYLSGEARDELQERELLHRIGNVTGVREIRNELVRA